MSRWQIVTESETPPERDPGVFDVTEQTYPDLAVVEATREHIRRRRDTA